MYLIQEQQAEMAGILNTAQFEFFGLKMQQNNLALPALNRLLKELRPNKIIEIGAGDCGLTLFFAIYAYVTDNRLFTYDIVDRNPAQSRLLNKFNATLEMKDCLEDESHINYLINIISSPGRNLIVCDAGKALEFNLYAPYVRPGDVMLTHDYAPNQQVFDSFMKSRFWNWLENWDDRVSDACLRYNLQKYKEQDMNPAAWGAWIKV